MRHIGYHIITQVANTRSGYAYIMAYVANNYSAEYDKKYIYYATCITWIASPALIKTRLRDFLDCHSFAADKEIREWKKINAYKLQMMEKYVSEEEVRDYIKDLENFIRVTFLIAAQSG